jgi:hypothetical protein
MTGVSVHRSPLGSREAHWLGATGERPANSLTALRCRGRQYLSLSHRQRASLHGPGRRVPIPGSVHRRALPHPVPHRVLIGPTDRAAVADPGDLPDHAALPGLSRRSDPVIHFLIRRTEVRILRGALRLLGLSRGRVPDKLRPAPLPGGRSGCEDEWTGDAARSQPDALHRAATSAHRALSFNRSRTCY